MKLYKLLDNRQRNILRKDSCLSFYRPLLLKGKDEAGIFGILQDINDIYNKAKNLKTNPLDTKPDNRLLEKIEDWYQLFKEKMNEPECESNGFPSNLEIILSMIMQTYCSCFTSENLSDLRIRKEYINKNQNFVSKKSSFVEVDLEQYNLKDQSALIYRIKDDNYIYEVSDVSENEANAFFHIHEIKYTEDVPDYCYNSFDADRKISNFLDTLYSCYKTEEEVRLFIMNKDMLPYSYKNDIKFDNVAIESNEAYLYYYFMGVLDIVHNNTPEYIYLKLDGLKPIMI